MRFQTPLIEGRLIRRYKRFLADVSLPDGTVVVAHCPNPGAMTGLKAEGMRVFLEPNDDPKKKLKYGWRLAELPGGTMVGIDTAVPNRVVKEALLATAIPELADYDTVLPEQKYGTNSRIDFLLRSDALPDAYVEVKNVHFLRDSDWAEFPDSVTARGTKHLHELATVAQAGKRAVMLYLVQHRGCGRFKLAEDVDPNYAAAFRAARAVGVQMLCFNCTITPTEVVLDRALPIHVD
ncbi:MAG: DNA/RNA nuclease SfsA [Planktomarina sp.]